MNLAQIENLRTLIDLKYPHMCFNEDDLKQFLNIPWEAKKFYPMRGRSGWYDKKGFFHNGKVTIWANRLVKPNHVRIADKEIPTLSTGANWSQEFSFENVGNVSVIQRMMKLKAFW